MTAVNQPKPTPLSPQSRMSLQKLVKGRISQPTRSTVFGPEGIGKTTFAAGAPKPIFLGAEEGSNQLDVTRFQSPENWAEVIEAVRTLTKEPHDYETLVIDTLDWVEPLIWSHICRRDSTAKGVLTSVESYGYGKGYSAALDEWRILVQAIEEMRRAKPMHVILLAHAHIKSFKNPEGEDFDRYELKLNKLAAGLVKEWSDAVLFANYETLTETNNKTKRVRGIDTGARLLHTERRAAFDAKNRYSLPETIPLAWADFVAGVAAHRTADPAVLLAEIERKLKDIGGQIEKDGGAAIARAAGDATKLAQLNNWVNFRLAEKADKEVPS